MTPMSNTMDRFFKTQSVIDLSVTDRSRNRAEVDNPFKDLCDLCNPVILQSMLNSYKPMGSKEWLKDEIQLNDLESLIVNLRIKKRQEDRRISPYVFLSEYTMNVENNTAWHLDTDPEEEQIDGVAHELFDVI